MNALPVSHSVAFLPHPLFDRPAGKAVAGYALPGQHPERVFGRIAAESPICVIPVVSSPGPSARSTWTPRPRSGTRLRTASQTGVHGSSAFVLRPKTDLRHGNGGDGLL